MPPAGGLGDRVAQLLLLAAVSTVVLVLVDRVARRALPLVTLLDLSMLFPDHAPSRLKVAREAIRKRPIEEQLARVRDAGAEPGAVAREILTLVAALSRHDRPTRGHAERVRMFTDLLATQLKLPQRDRDLLRWAAILHDIGKLAVPASLLNKPAKPTDDEWRLLQAHPAHGAEIAAALLPWLGEWGRVIVEHHERFDGTGYPNGLAGAQISLGARIVSVADAYDVMTAARAYKRPVSRAAALKELVTWSGRQFDPTVVRAMVAVGAPRLRRAQGVVAWLADVPLVATGSVPTATVARVVGAGALATGAVTGGVALSDGFETPRAHAGAAATSPAAAGGQRGADRDVAPQPRESTSGSRAAADPGDTEPGDGAGRSARPAPGGATSPQAGGVPSGGTAETGPEGGSAAAPQPEERNGGAASAGSGSRAEPAPGGGSTGPSPTSGPDRPVEKVVEDTVGAVGRIVEDPVGEVGSTVGRAADTVADIAGDPVGTVEDVVEDPVGTVTGTVGGLLGGGSSASPSPSPSPSASGGGLLGGLLGRR
jgi:putative nucleotidyltransferase with HDIG domain